MAKFDPLKCALPVKGCAPPSQLWFHGLNPHRNRCKWHLDRFSLFRTVHSRDRATDRGIGLNKILSKWVLMQVAVAEWLARLTAV